MKIDILQVAAIIAAASAVDALPVLTEAAGQRTSSRGNSDVFGARHDFKSPDTLVRRGKPHPKMPDLANTDNWFPDQDEKKSQPDKGSSSKPAEAGDKSGASTPKSDPRSSCVFSFSSTNSKWDADRERWSAELQEELDRQINKTPSLSRQTSLDDVKSISGVSSGQSSPKVPSAAKWEKSTSSTRASSPTHSRQSSQTKDANLAEYVRAWAHDHSGATTPKSGISTGTSTPILHDPRFLNLFAKDGAKKVKAKPPSSAVTPGHSGASTPFLNEHEWDKKSGNPPWTPSGRTASPSSTPGSSPRSSSSPTPGSSDRDVTLRHWAKKDGEKSPSTEGQKEELERFRPKPLITTGLGPGGEGPLSSPGPRVGGDKDFAAEFRKLNRDNVKLIEAAEDASKAIDPHKLTKGGKWAAVALGGTLLSAGIYSTLPVKLPNFPPPATSAIVATAAK